MSLASKIFLILSAVVALYALTDYAVQRVTLTRSFQALERADAQRDADRVVGAIQEEQARLDQLCKGRASWYGTDCFLLGMRSARSFPFQNPLLLHQASRFAEAHLSPSSFERDGLDLLFVVDPSGRVLWSRIQDPATQEVISLRDFPRNRLGRSHPLLARGLIEEKDSAKVGASLRDVDRKRGIFLTERGPMLASSHPIAKQDAQAETLGTIIVGRFLGPELVDALSRRSKVDFDLWSLDGKPLPEPERRALDIVSSGAAQPFVREHDERLLHAYAIVPDILKAPGLLVRANLDRRVSEMGSTAARYALVSTVTIGLLMLLVLLALIQRTVLQPITTLTRNAVAFGKTEDATIGFDLRRDDEVGILSREFDNMLAKLARSRAELVRTARAAGMSEIATGILHNVGNVLNSVNVSASLVGRKTRELGVDDLEALSRILAEHAQDLASFVQDDPRGKHLQPFVGALAKEMRQAREGIDQELSTLELGIAHIRELIESQQSFVGRSGVVEAVRLEEQLEEALRISEKALAPDGRLEVVREYAELPPVRVDRHKLLEILVNVLQNARQAMAGAGTPERRIVLRTSDLGERVRLEVIDNGPGIDPGNLVRIFNLGFTTRADGHGVGLHASANSAKELRGVLRAESAGLGHGATFVLELPKHPEHHEHPIP